MYRSLCVLYIGVLFGAHAGHNEWLRSRFTTLKELFRGDLEYWEAPLYLQKNYPYYLSGFDDDNKPIWIAEFGHWDVRKIVEGGGQMVRDLDRYINQAAWRVINSTTLRSSPDFPVTEYTGIVDFDGYSLQQLSSTSTISFISQKARQLREVMRIMDGGYCINVNFMAEKLLNLLKPMLGRDFEKVEVHGTNKAKWLPTLLRRYSQSQLPPQYGGLWGYYPVRSYG